LLRDARGKSTHNKKNGTIGGYLLSDLCAVCVIPDFLQYERDFVVVDAPGILGTSAAQVLQVSRNEDAPPCGIVMAPWWEAGIGELLLTADYTLG
jgi:hypothetical protein